MTAAEWVQARAEALCRAAGEDPDEIVVGFGSGGWPAEVPRWHDYWHDAKSDLRRLRRCSAIKLAKGIA